MKHKTIIIICLMVCIIFSLSSVYANEDNNTSIQDENNYITSNNDLNTIYDFSSTGTFSDLNKEIQNANNELKLTKNYIYTDEDSNLINGITINKPIIINGNGFTINGNEKSIAFDIKSSTIILKNINFENCKGKSTGAIIFNKDTNGELIDCTFTNNRAWAGSSSSGGCIYAKSSNLKIENCNFIENQVDSNSESYGGCIYATSSTNLTIKNTNFIDNWGGSTYNSDGGCIYAKSSNLKIENSKFIRNSARHQGGVIFIKDSSLIIDSSDFTDNQANSDGGCIYAKSSNLEIDNSGFIGNTAYGEGGSIKVLESMLNIMACDFTNNIAQYGGSALYSSSSMGILENCKFKGNSLTNRILNPLDSQYIQEGCLINCDFDNSDINIAIGGGLRNITKLNVIVTNNIVDITVNNPNFYKGTEYFLAIEKGPFPSSHNSWQLKDSLVLYNNHAITSINNMDLGVNQYRVYYYNFLNEFYYYFNLTRTEQSSISVESITAQRGNKVTLNVYINVKGVEDSSTIGNVKFTIDGITYNTPVKEGESKISFKMPKNAGTFSYPITFSPYSEYIYGSSTNLKVFSKYGTKITIKSMIGNQGKKLKLTAIVKDDNGNKIKKGKVTFQVGINAYSANVKNGEASITITCPKAYKYKENSKTKGNYRYDTTYYKSIYGSSVTFKGDGTYSSSSASFKVTSKGKTIKHKWRIYNYKTFTFSVKKGFKTYKKNSRLFIIAMKPLTKTNKLFIGVGKDNDHPISFKVKKHYKKNGKWQWDNWFYCNKNQYMEATYGKAIKIDKVKINCYSPYLEKIY